MMRSLLAAFVALSAVSPIVAQSFVVPNGTLPNVGTCNAFPFNTTDMRYQALVHAADLGSAPGVISGLALSPCTTGVRTMQAITIKLAHYNGGTLSTTFDTNLTSPGPASTVLDTVDHAWHMTADTWNEIGLQYRFQYNGVDDLVVEILVIGTAGAGATTHREGTHERLYQGSYVGQTSGAKSTAAFKLKLLFGDAELQTFGTGCPGTNGTPAFGFSGSAQLGATLNFECRNAAASGLVLFVFGPNNRLPVFPVDLTAIGAPGCTLYHDPAATAGTNADANGFASLALVVPNDPTLPGAVLYGSALLMDPGANALGWTSSNYGRALLGH